LIKELDEQGKNVVLVVLSGSAITVDWEEKNIPAIIQAWYPGQIGGQAVADVIFGDYNPAGRLPVTVYKSVDQLPDFKEYNMIGHTYRYFDGEVLYPFGYGLSFTQFDYSDLKIFQEHDTIHIDLLLKNSGNSHGDEVVQVYVTDDKASVPVPIKSLKAFKRISLKRGEKKRVSFKLTSNDFALYDKDMRRTIESGDFTIMVGGNSKTGLEGKITL
jgi:beta-glucosidase